MQLPELLSAAACVRSMCLQMCYWVFVTISTVGYGAVPPKTMSLQRFLTHHAWAPETGRRRPAKLFRSSLIADVHHGALLTQEISLRRPFSGVLSSWSSSSVRAGRLRRLTRGLWAARAARLPFTCDYSLSLLDLRLFLLVSLRPPNACRRACSPTLNHPPLSRPFSQNPSYNLQAASPFSHSKRKSFSRCSGCSPQAGAASEPLGGGASGT